MIKKLEGLANIAVIVTAIVVCTVLAKKYLLPAKQANTSAAATAADPFAPPVPRRSFQPGTKISLPGINWSKSDRTLVMILSTTCHFCTESAPFYQKLQQEKPNNVQLVAVLPQAVEESRAYIRKLGLAIEEIVQSPLGAVGASGTPTLILINKDGSIRDSWAGKLPEDEAAKVIRQITEAL